MPRPDGQRQAQLAEAKHRESHGLPVGNAVAQRPGFGADSEPAHEQPNQDNEPAQAAREDGLARVDGRALHAVFLGGLVGQGQAGQAVGYQVNPQDVNGQQRHGQAKERRDEEGHDFTRAAGQNVANEFEDVVEDAPPVPHGVHNGGEVVVEQNHGRRFFGYLRAVDAHGHADVGVFQGGRVVHAVAGHGHELVPGLQRTNDAQLLSGVYAGVHPHPFHHGGKGGLVELGQLRPGQYQFVGLR